MADWLESVKSIVSLVADSKAILGLALVSGSIAGVIPRVGLVRALSLGFTSYLKTIYPLSVRASEIKQLNDSILRMKKGSYITVTGGKGNGKTCLIDTTLNRHLGVVKISVSCLSYSIVDYVSGKYNIFFFYRLNQAPTKTLSLIRHFAHLLEFKLTSLNQWAVLVVCYFSILSCLCAPWAPQSW